MYRGVIDWSTLRHEVIRLTALSFYGAHIKHLCPFHPSQITVLLNNLQHLPLISWRRWNIKRTAHLKEVICCGVIWHGMMRLIGLRFEIHSRNIKPFYGWCCSFEFFKKKSSSLHKDGNYREVQIGWNRSKFGWCWFRILNPKPLPSPNPTLIWITFIQICTSIIAFHFHNICFLHTVLLTLFLKEASCMVLRAYVRTYLECAESHELKEDAVREASTSFFSITLLCAWWRHNRRHGAM